ncbi:MAG: thioether cross-link-forming SCIFF peptide maturase [Clostridia bacterium]
MIHVFQQDDIRVVLDVNSGAVHILDDVTFELLKNAKDKDDILEGRILLRDRYSEIQLDEAVAELDALMEEGSLFSPFPDLKTDRTAEKQGLDMKALCLHVAHDCNLRCSYCFADKGKYGDAREKMPLDVAQKAIDFLLENSSRKHVEVDFFGGEPLMNFEVVKKTVEYALERQKDRQVHFTLTTNATILDDEILAFINRHMDNVVLSLDGRKETHDRMRRYQNGRGSYDRVLGNIRRILADRKKGSYFIRGTFTRENLDFSEDIRHLADLGFREISIEPVTGGAFAFNREELAVILKEYEEFAMEYARQEEYRFYHFNLDLYHGPCVYKRISSCGAGFEYAAVVPDGSLYACHQFAGMEAFRLGDVFNGIHNTALMEEMRSANVLNKEECKECWARFLCSGGCHALAYFKNGDIKKPDQDHCTLQKKRMECAMIIAARRDMRNE